MEKNNFKSLKGYLPNGKIPLDVASRNRPASIDANICCKIFVGSHRMGFGPNVGSDCPHIFLHLVKNSDGVTAVICLKR